MSTSDKAFEPVQVYRRLLFEYAGHHWPAFLIAMLAMVAFAAADTGFAWLMKPLLDGSFVERDPEIIRIMPFAVIGLFLVRGTAGYISTFGLAYVGRHVIKRLRTELFGHLLKLPISFYDHNASGQLLSKLTFNVEQVAQSAANSITVLIRDTLTVIGLLILMVYLNAKLTGFVLVIGPVMAILVRVVSRRFRRISHHIQDSMGDVSHVTGEIIDGHKVVKVFGGKQYERDHFEQVNEKNRRLNMKLAATQAASIPIVQMLGALAISGIIYVATSDSMQTVMTPGSFAAFMGAMLGLMTPIRHLTSVNAEMQKGIAAARSIFEMLALAPEPDDGDVHIDRAVGDIEFRQVGFRYINSGADVLSDINLHIKAGQTVALVGRSGSGKSTLASLIARFYDIDSGEILLDGESLSKYSLADLRRQISYVSQDVTLFNDTISGNIAYGELSGHSAEEIETAARAAYAWSFIEKLPDSLATEVGENGVLLSGGQRQRLAIARALLKGSPILILDEATSALDSESEQYIQNALEGLMKNRTTLVIAHRLSTIEKADLIVVMDGGRIVETGQHDELLAREGAYANLHRTQFQSLSSSNE